MDTDKLLIIVKAILDGEKARPLLEELSRPELAFLAWQFHAITPTGNGPPRDSDGLVDYIIDVVNHREIQRLTTSTPGGKMELAGTLDGDGKRVLSGHDHGAKIRDAMLPKAMEHLITPSEHARKLGIHHIEDTIMGMRSILDRLLKQGRKDPKSTMDIGGEYCLIKDLVFYGHREGSGGGYTYFSDARLGPYFLQQLNLLPAKSGDLVGVEEFCRFHLHVDKVKYDPKIKEIGYALLTQPDIYKDLPVSATPLVGLYRYQETKLGLSPKLVPWLEKQLGLLPYLKEKPSDMSSPANFLTRMELQKDKAMRADFHTFLMQGLIQYPDRIVNEKTGRTFKDSIQGYRLSAGAKALYVHHDMEDFLKREWLAPRKEAGAEWMSEYTLRNVLGIERARFAPALKAIQALLKKLRQKGAQNTVEIDGKDMPYGEVIRRFTHQFAGAAFHIHKDAVEAGVISKEMVLKYIAQHPDSVGTGATAAQR